MAHAFVLRRPSVNSFSQKPLHGSRLNFVESYLSTVCPDRFFFFQFSSDDKRYEDIGYHGGILAITFLGNRPFLRNFVVL